MADRKGRRELILLVIRAGPADTLTDMQGVARHILVLMLITAQLALGGAAGGVVCLGSPLPHTPAESCCSHDPAHAAWPVPVPDEHDDCVCIDAAAPDARPEQADGDALLRTAGVFVFAHLPAERPASGAGIERPSPFRPPGPAPGLRTTRLLI